MSDKPERLTTAFGNPVPDNQNSLTAGPRGPVLMQDFHLIEKMAHFNRERVPERVVHAKGYGGYGTFRVTQDISRYTRANLFGAIGKETAVLRPLLHRGRRERLSRHGARSARLRPEVLSPRRATGTSSATTRRSSSSAIR